VVLQITNTFYNCVEYKFLCVECIYQCGINMCVNKYLIFCKYILNTCVYYLRVIAIVFKSVFAYITGFC